MRTCVVPRVDKTRKMLSKYIVKKHKFTVDQKGNLSLNSLCFVRLDLFILYNRSVRGWSEGLLITTSADWLIKVLHTCFL